MKRIEASKGEPAIKSTDGLMTPVFQLIDVILFQMPKATKI